MRAIYYKSTQLAGPEYAVLYENQVFEAAMRVATGAGLTCSDDNPNPPSPRVPVSQFLQGLQTVRIPADEK